MGTELVKLQCARSGRDLALGSGNRDSFPGVGRTATRRIATGLPVEMLQSAVTRLNSFSVLCSWVGHVCRSFVAVRIHSKGIVLWYVYPKE